MRVVVETGARLHLGFLDLNGECGRLFGSLGVALEAPRCVVEARPASRTEVDGEPAEDARAVLRALEHATGEAAPVAVRLRETIPRHVGLGSGTQLRLAVARAAARARGHEPPVRALARIVGRGRRSGIGIATFEHGGFVVDAGHRRDGREAADAIPPVVLRSAVPDDWRFVLVTPADGGGLSGSDEESAFRTLPPMRGETVGRLCRLLLVKAAPALLTDDIDGFGEAITEIQRLVGEHFAPYQGGGTYTSPTGKRAAELARELGAVGVGQSSWGPTVFGLTRGRDAAAGLVAELGRALGDDARVWCAGAPNHGATCRVEP